MACHEAVGRLICPGYENLGIPPLYVHDLTGTEDAQRLLSKPLRIHPAASKVLPRLQQWNPEVASAFSEKDGAVDRIPFRLVTRHQVWSSGGIDSFVAASYCWHNDEWQVPARFSYTPNDWPYPVSSAMLRALLSNLKDGEAFWIDQLCIDQNKSEQKAHAIANMDTIYRNANRVLVLLEDVDMDQDVERSFKLLATTLSEPEGIPSDELYLSENAFAENFESCFAQGLMIHLVNFSQEVFDCRWFTRAWCCQEYQLSTDREFIFVGHEYSCVALNSNFFRDFLNNLEHSIDQDESGNLEDALSDLSVRPEFQRFSFGIGVDRTDSKWADRRTHLVFFELTLLSCFYERDAVSIALNISGLPLSFGKDITDRLDYRFILALILLAMGDAAVLHSIGPPLHKTVPAPSHQGVIRWPEGPDFRYWSDLNYTGLSESPKIRQIDHLSMKLDLFLLQSQPQKPCQGSFERAKALWEALQIQTPRSDMTEVAIATYAATLDVGLSWMTQSLRGHDKAEGTTESEAIVEAVSTKHVVDAMLRLLGRSKHIERTRPLIMRLDKESVQHALIFLPSRLVKHMETGVFQYSLAVPAALNNPEATGLRRLWILEKAKTFEQSLSIVGQGCYLGPELAVDSEVIYAEGVSVVGRWNEDLDAYDSSDEWANHEIDVPDLDLMWTAWGRI